MSVTSMATELIGKRLRLIQPVKEANLYLKTQAENAWAQLSVCLGLGVHSQQTQQQKACGRGVQNLAQQRLYEK